MMSSPSLRKISRVLGNHFLENSLLRFSPAYTREMANRQLTPPPATGSNNEPLDLKGNKGPRTTYRFADINKLKVSTADVMKNLSPMADQAPAAEMQHPVAFAYADGILTVSPPAPVKPDAAKPAEMPEENPQMEAMMKQMLGDMRLSVKLVDQEADHGET